jgi:Plavaka transposase
MDALPVTPRWKCTPIHTDGYTTTHPVNLIWRDASEVVHHIFGNPIFANHMEYDPYEINNNGEREYGEWMSCEQASEIQVSVFRSSCVNMIYMVSRVNYLLAQLSCPSYSHLTRHW